MAGSRRPGPLTPPVGVCSIPARTPGSLGINDQADPNVTTLMGDTSGPVGVCDAADPTLPLYTPADPYANLVCRADDKLPLSLGFPAKQGTPAPTPGQGSVALDDAQEMSLKITTYFEGGKSMNYQALADDSDHQATSFGLIQWNFGQNTLGPLLKQMLDKDATAFANCFGPEADYDTLKKALQTGSQGDECKWARDRIKNKRAAWKDAFWKLGAVTAFNQIQLKQAKSDYHPKALGVIEDIREISPKLFTNVEFRSYAAIFDLCVQQGSLHEPHDGHKALDKIKSRVKDEKPASQLELMKIVVTERGRTASAVSRTDCISRRMGILTGSSYKSTEGTSTLERKNPQLTLIGQCGAKYVQGV